MYCLSRQLTAPFFLATAIADVLRMAVAHAADEAADEHAEVSGYGMPLLFGGVSFSNTPNLHWTAVVAIINAIAANCRPSKIWKEMLFARVAAARYGKRAKGTNRINKTATAIIYAPDLFWK